MSKAELYMEYGLKMDPKDPDHMGKFLRRQSEESWYGAKDEDSLLDLPNDIRITFGFPDRRKGENARVSGQPEKSNDKCKHEGRQKRKQQRERLDPTSSIQDKERRSSFVGTNLSES